MSEKILLSLQESQAKITHTLFYEVLNLIQEGALFIHCDGTIIWVNHIAKKLLHLPEHLPHPCHLAEFLPDDFFGFSLRETLQLGFSHKLLYRTLYGREIEILSKFFYDGPPSAHGLLVIFNDLTEKRHISQSLQRNEHLRYLGEILASTTHEIRNSLGGIRGYASLLYRDLSRQPPLQDMAHYIIEGTKALETLVAKILQYARPLQIAIQSEEIGMFLRHFVKSVKIDPSHPDDVLWHLHIPQDAIIAPIDSQALKSALLNLTFNAFQAMPRGGILTLSLLKMDSCYQISLSDTGIGMDDELLKKIFSPFFTTKQKGNGLGLVEVQKVVQAHYGTIDVRSSPQKGTTFTLTLPLKRS